MPLVKIAWRGRESRRRRDKGLMKNLNVTRDRPLSVVRLVHPSPTVAMVASPGRMKRKLNFEVLFMTCSLVLVALARIQMSWRERE